MKKMVNICIGSKERVKELVKTLEAIDCSFEIKLGKTALEATSMEDMMGLDMRVPRPLYIYGDPENVEQAVRVVDAYCV